MAHGSARRVISTVLSQMHWRQRAGKACVKVCENELNIIDVTNDRDMTYERLSSKLLCCFVNIDY